MSFLLTTLALIVLGALPFAAAAGRAVGGLRRAFPEIPPEYLERRLVF